jgi:pimeloyl-ACP methyl ester carboxylesterase
LPAAEFEVHGLENRHRQAGLGVAVIAARSPAAAQSTRDYLSRSRCTAATCILRLESTLEDLAAGSLRGTLELHEPTVEHAVTIGSREVPIEYDVSAAIGYFIAESRVLDLELPNFLGGEDVEDISGLYAFQTYRPGRFPVVFVHGTQSSLGRFGGMVNDLFADPVLRDRIQIWFFTYPSGQPIALSADALRSAIEEARREFDPEGKDPALDQAVVIGHSQGGLLTRHLVVTDHEEQLWSSLFTRPLEDFELKDESRKLASRIFRFEPQKSVRRVVYLATPHRGSFHANRWYAKLVSRVIRLPESVAGFALEVATLNRDAIRGGIENASPTSLSGMQEDSPYLRALALLPAAPGVTQHSIVAIDGDDEPPYGDDGVVAFRSAALPGSSSLFVVRDGHSCQSNPHVINEVRRILREHVAAFDR